MDKQYIVGLKRRLADIDEERAAIVKLLRLWEGEKTEQDVQSLGAVVSPQSFSVSGRIVDAVVELIHKTGRPVKNSEIFDYINEKQLPFGNTDNPERMLSAILSNETKKRDARLKKAARGYYEIKQ